MATNPSSATMRLIELAEHLTPSGEIGDGRVAQFHEAAALARLEQNPADVLAHLASKAGRVVDPEQYEAMRRYCGGHARSWRVATTDYWRTPFVVMGGGRCRNCGCPQ